MDQAWVDWAITAVDFGEDTTRAELWFKVLTSSYQDPEAEAPEPVGSWDEFVARLKPAAEREGFESEKVEYFIETLQNSSDPIGDVLLPLYQQQDSLPQEYLDLHAAQAAEAAQTAEPQVDAAQAEAEAEEQLWSWDDTQQQWLRYEDDQWVPQVQNGYALNYEKTEWVPIEAAAPVEAAEPDQESVPNDEAAAEAFDQAALTEDLDLPDEDLDMIDLELTDEDLELLENLELTDEAPELTEEVATEQVETVLEFVPTALETAIQAVDGIELGDFTEEQINAVFDRLLAATPSAE